MTLKSQGQGTQKERKGANFMSEVRVELGPGGKIISLRARI